MDKFNIRYLLYLPIVFIFFPAFSFVLGGNNYRVFFLCVLINVFLLFLIKKNEILNYLHSLIRKTSLKYFIIAIILLLVFSIFNVLLFRLDINTFVKTILLQLIFGIFPIFIFFLYVIKMFTINRFFKIFIFCFWCNLIVGFISYIGQIYDINFINNIFDFFANERILKYISMNMDVSLAKNYSSYNLPRLDNLFAEPSFYATFLFIFLPLSYTVASFSDKIYKFKVLDILIKKTIVIFHWVSIILTQSPIFLIFSLILTCVYFYKKIIYSFKNFYYIYLMIILFILLLMSQIDFTESYLHRIIKIVSNVKSLEDLIYIEPSLSTRIISFYNTFLIFIKHPVIGVGLGGVDNLMLSQLIDSPVRLTSELMRNINLAILTKKNVWYNTSVIYNLLATGGIFVFCLFVKFHISLITSMHYLYRKIKNEYISKISYGIYMSLIALTICYFYQFFWMQREIWIVYSIAIILIYKYKKGDFHE